MKQTNLYTPESEVKTPVVARTHTLLIPLPFSYSRKKEYSTIQEVAVADELQHCLSVDN